MGHVRIFPRRAPFGMGDKRVLGLPKSTMNRSVAPGECTPRRACFSERRGEFFDCAVQHGEIQSSSGCVNGLLRLDGIVVDVIQAPKRKPSIMRYELSDYVWIVIKAMLPNKPRGVRRVNDRRVLNGIFWVLRTGVLWRDLPETYGPRTTCYNRFARWRLAGVWEQIMNTLTAGPDAAVQMTIHPSSGCINGAGIADNNHQDMGEEA